jgi:hypothetical protein
MLAAAVLVGAHKARPLVLAVLVAVVTEVLETVQYKELMAAPILVAVAVVTVMLALIISGKMAAQA